MTKTITLQLNVSIRGVTTLPSSCNPQLTPCSTLLSLLCFDRPSWLYLMMRCWLYTGCVRVHQSVQYCSYVNASREPVSTPPGHQEPMSTPPGYQEPVSTPSGHQEPLLTPPGHQEPSLTSPCHQEPLARPLGHQEPLATPLGHQEPKSMPLQSFKSLASHREMPRPLQNLQETMGPLEDERSKPLASHQEMPRPLQQIWNMPRMPTSSARRSRP